ncbi:MAG: universal stress protein [Flavipsychrobacter sp.]
MSVIVTATDFSTIAQNAVHYACSMAKDTNASVVVIHSYAIPVAFNDNPMPIMPLEEGKNLAEEQLDKLLSELKLQYEGVAISGFVTYGDITDNLKSYVAEEHPWLIVIGNSSREDDISWLGSNLLNALKHIHCPVIAIPKGLSYKTIQNVCYACDYKHIAEKLPAERIKLLVNKTNSQLHVLNVDKENKNFDTDTPYQSEQLHELLQEVNPQYHNVVNEDIDEGILDFVKAEQIDWLVMIPHNHSFFEKLFHKSNTNAVVKKADIPIIALHDKA